MQVPFHGRTVKGWVLGTASEIPARVAEVRKVLSPVRFFDPDLLRLYRWIAHRYLTPLSVAIDRGIPARIVSEEGAPVPPPARPASLPAPDRLMAYQQGENLADACGRGVGGRVRYLVRPLPADESVLLVEAVGRCLSRGREAVVVVPEAEPVPHGARALLEAFGDAVCWFAGGDQRERYRMWLDILGGRYRVVVGTRPAVFAPVRRLGLAWVHREPHTGHREERSPSWHVRDLALMRAEIAGTVGVVSALCPSGEAVAAELVPVRATRAREQAAWPIVETVKPGPEGRAPRLVDALRKARAGFLLSSRGGYGVARVCRACGEPAACASCSGVLEQRKGAVVCSVCGAAGTCANCGASDFGIQRRGAERVAEWAARLAAVPVREAEGPPEGDEVTVGTPGSVPDAGPRALDVVGILDADRMLRRPGLSGPERVLATWFEAAAWARPRPRGRVVLETEDPGDPSVQALVRNEPWFFHVHETPRRAEAGFPPGFPVFRVVCTASVADAIQATGPHHLLVSGLGDERVCLVTVSPESLDAFVARVREWARAGEVRRVEAEPHL